MFNLNKIKLPFNLNLSHAVSNITHKTYSGTTTKTLKKGLPKDTESICPVCKEVLEARLFEEDGKVFIEKNCPVHGIFKDIYWSDAEMYLKAEKWVFEEGKGLSNPLLKDADSCPEECGLCNMHMSHTVLGNIDLTNRCNLLCPICFANAKTNGNVYEPSFPAIVKMLETLREEQPARCGAIQFSGGEPTLSPHFLDAVKKAKEMGFAHIQAATNGIRFSDAGFTHQCREAGLHTLYLQFDGLDDNVYIKTRGRPLLETKMKVIENVRQAKMKVVFVPTIIRGINDDQVGEILKFAIKNSDVTSGISYQPIAFTGRTPEEERIQRRYTLPDLAHDIEKQTGILRARKDWYPLSFASPISRLLSNIKGEETTTITCHPHCSLATYIFVDEDKKPTPVTDVIDVERMFTSLDKIARSMTRTRFKSFSKIRALNAIKGCFDKQKAPKGLTYEKFLYAVEGIIDRKVGRREGSEKTYTTLLVMGMHFQDSYNLDLDRLKRCVVHYSSPNNHLYPFCAYNAGTTFRPVIEKAFSQKQP
jgi:7,8-dihydro-6-hydroxymethylpterin dimethyltransferase